MSNFCFRTEENLKNLWDKLKKNARRCQAFERREVLATGGGVRNTTGDPTATDLKVLQVIGPSGVGLINEYDGDAPDAATIYIGHIDNNTGISLVNDDTENNIGTKQINSPSTSIGNASLVDINFADIIIPETKQLPGENKWDEVVPRHLYSKKSDALRCNSESNPSTTLSCEFNKSSSKRSVSEELEWAKIMKRRRPTVQTNENQEKLTAAKLELTIATKLRMEEESKRNQELFEIEKRRKESEAELAELQVLKMKRDLGL